MLRVEAAADVEDDETVSDAVGDTMSSLLGIPTEGCLEELSLELGSAEVELVVAFVLDAVGCTSLLGAGPTDGLDST